MDEFSVIIVIIIIGVLITRMIVVWMNVFKKYAESKIDIDVEQSDNDLTHSKQLLVAAIVGTLITASIIYMIFVATPITEIPEL